MSEQKLTDWYSDDQKLVRIGVYKRRPKMGLELYSWWDGKIWGLLSETIRDAKNYGSLCSAWQFLEWRGLAEDPNADYITVRMPRPVIVGISRYPIACGYGFDLALRGYTEPQVVEAAQAIREAMKC